MTQTKYIGKITLMAVALFGLIIASAGPVQAAPADSTTMAQSLAALRANSAFPEILCEVPTTPLAFGLHGPEVKRLQVWLNGHGFTVVPPGRESEYFGPLTQFALLKFQSTAGVRPVSGFYGPLTMATMWKRCVADYEKSFGLTVSASKLSPEGATVPYDTIREEILRFDVSGRGELDAITLHRSGSGADSGFAELYLYEGDVRLTDNISFDDRTETLTFDDLNIDISGSRTFSIMADLATANEFSRDGVEIRSTESIRATSPVSGSFPVRGDLFNRTDTRAGRITIRTEDGVLSDPTIGETGAKLAEFEMIPELGDDAELRLIALTVGGSADPASISNFVLKRGGQTVAVASTVNARGQIVFRFEKPLIIPPGASHTFELFADISPAAISGEVYRIFLETPVDFYIVDAASGRGLPVLSGGYNNTLHNGADSSRTTILGGTATYTFRGPAVSQFAVGQNDVELIRFDVAAEANLDVRKLRIMLTAGGADAKGDLLTAGGLCNNAAANYRDVKLVDATTGQLLALGKDTTCKTGDQDINRTFLFEGSWFIAADASRTFKVTADVGSFNPAAGETIRATLMAFEREDIRNLDTGSFLSAREVVPAGNLSGATHSVHSSEAAASLAETFALIAADSVVQ